MKIFPKLADRTALTDQEKVTYFLLRTSCVVTFDQSQPHHEETLSNMCLNLLKGGKTLFKLDNGDQVDFSTP